MDTAPLWKFWLAGLLIAAATIGVYWNTLGSEFVTWDDRDYIYENPLLERGFGAIWGDLFADKPHEQYYPMVFTSFWMEYQFVKLKPRLYHVTQMVLHAANAVLVLFVLRCLGVTLFPATVAAALFALHPINVASVAWVTERKNTLSLLLMLSALLLYMQYRRCAGPWRYVTAIFAYVMGLLSKTVVLTLAPILILTDRVLDYRWTWASVRRSIPFFVLGLLMAAVTAKVESRQAKSENPHDVVVRIPIAARAITHYVSKLVVPVNLLPIYPRWPADPETVFFLNLADPKYLLSMGAVIAASLLIWRYRRQIGAITLWGIAFGLLAAFPMLGLKYFNFLQFSFVSDHFIYHSTPGLFLAVGMLLDRLRRGPQPHAASNDKPAADRRTSLSAARAALVYVFTAGILAACAGLTIQQNPIYKDGVSFWNWTLQGNPDCYPGNFNLANHYFRRRDFKSALHYYRESARIMNTNIFARHNCALCCRQLGQTEEAIAYYKDALLVASRTNRHMIDLHTEYAKYLRYLGRRQEAIAEYKDILAEYKDILRKDPKNTYVADAIRRLSAQLGEPTP